MPTYPYRCDACEHAFEIYQPITAGAKRKCPACGRMKLRRLIGAGAAILFKGSGFYETDYRSKSYKEGAKAEEKKKSEGDAKKKKDSSTTGKSGDAASS